MNSLTFRNTLVFAEYPVWPLFWISSSSVDAILAVDFPPPKDTTTYVSLWLLANRLEVLPLDGGVAALLLLAVLPVPVEAVFRSATGKFLAALTRTFTVDGMS